MIISEEGESWRVGGVIISGEDESWGVEGVPGVDFEVVKLQAG